MVSRRLGMASGHSRSPMAILTYDQLFTTLTQIFGIISVLHGLGNHITIVEEVGELHNFLLFTWITVFFFNLAIPTGKVAVAAFLIEMNSQSSMYIGALSMIPFQLTKTSPQIPRFDAALLSSPV